MERITAEEAADRMTDKNGRTIVEAVHAAAPVEIDGRLDDDVWERAKPYSMVRAAGNIRSQPDLEPEDGYVQFAWDHEFLYVACSFEDSDVIALGEEDQMLHPRQGDLMEVFLRPVGFTWYWELYATPRARKTLYFYPGPGHHPLHSTKDQDPSPLIVGAEVQGTLNHWEDVDEGWTAEMAIPLELLTARGETFEPGAEWLILIGRYNYSRYFEEAGPQLTMFPQLPRTDFHDYKNWGRLVIEAEPKIEGDK